MNNKLDDIDLIIKQKLTNIAFDVPENEWFLLNKAMSFKSFFKFNYNHFNIYYAGAIATLIIAFSFQFAQNCKLKSDIKRLEKIIENKKTVPVLSAPAFNPSNNRTTSIPEVPIKKEHSTSKNYHINKLPVNELINTNEVINDSASNVAKPVIQNKDTAHQINQVNKKIFKKKIYIKNNIVILSDTIIRYKTDH